MKLQDREPTLLNLACTFGGEGLGYLAASATDTHAQWPANSAADCTRHANTAMESFCLTIQPAQAQTLLIWPSFMSMWLRNSIS
jgi:hypothetical protein